MQQYRPDQRVPTQPALSRASAASRPGPGFRRTAAANVDGPDPIALTRPPLVVLELFERHVRDARAASASLGAIGIRAAASRVPVGLEAGSPHRQCVAQATHRQVDVGQAAVRPRPGGIVAQRPAVYRLGLSVSPGQVELAGQATAPTGIQRIQPMRGLRLHHCTVRLPPPTKPRAPYGVCLGIVWFEREGLIDQFAGPG